MHTALFSVYWFSEDTPTSWANESEGLRNPELSVLPFEVIASLPSRTPLGLPFSRAAWGQVSADLMAKGSLMENSKGKELKL